MALSGITVFTVAGKPEHEPINLVTASADKLVDRERSGIILDLPEPGLVGSSTLGVFTRYNI